MDGKWHSGTPKNNGINGCRLFIFCFPLGHLPSTMADFVSCRGNSCQGPIIPNTLSQEPQASFVVIVCEPLAVGSAVSWQFHYDFEMLRRDGSGAHAKGSYLCVKFSLEKGSIKQPFCWHPMRFLFRNVHFMQSLWNHSEIRQQFALGFEMASIFDSYIRSLFSSFDTRCRKTRVITIERHKNSISSALRS